MIYKEFNFGGKSNPLGSFGVIVVLTVLLVALFFIAKGIFTILSWAAPVLLILTAIFDYAVIKEYGRFIWNLLRTQPLWGIVAVILTIIGFPIVTGFLFFIAYARKSLKNYQKSQEPKYANYEEVVTEESKDDTDFLELKRPVAKPGEHKKQGSDYDDLFK
jgi:Na+-transporting methylmalonyl-CoA/oxaloacetate decarboxylase gamma subunit